MQRTILKIVGVGGGVVIGGSLAFASATAALAPVSEGAYLQWTPSAGTTHYTLVDEASCNGLTDYVSTNTVGNRDAYGVSLSLVPNGAQITQIDITPCASNNKAGGNSSFNVFYRLNGVNSSDAGNYTLSGTTPGGLAVTSFTGLTQVKSVSDTLEVGGVLSAGTKGARLSKISAVVTYTELAAPSGVGATPVSSSEIDLGWTDGSTFESGYVVERRNITASTTYATIATTTANITSYQDIGLSAATAYGYRIRAYNAGGYSTYSNTTSATTTP